METDYPNERTSKFTESNAVGYAVREIFQGFVCLAVVN